MNKTQKKRVQELSDKIEALISELEEILGEQQDALSELSEKAQEGPKGEALNDVISILEDAHGELDGAMDSLRSLAE
jgi:predicted ribosome quality control (RQC) complex YloA/Tae2 family protein